MKKSNLPIAVLIFLLVYSFGCVAAPVPVPTAVPSPVSSTITPSPAPPTQTPEPTETATPAPLTWEEFTSDTWGFSLDHPSTWMVMSNGERSGFLGWQVYWGVDDFDIMQMPGDRPAIDQVEEVTIAGQPAKRITGHYLGALADMGFQQYVKYIIQKGDLFYSFTLVAVDVNGVPSNMMNDQLPISEEDLELFEQMINTLKFKE